MVNIEMNQNDRGLLLRILDNYKEYRYKDYQKGIINSKELNYDYETLRHLIGLIKGTEKVDEDYLLTSKAYREKQGKANGNDDVKTPILKFPFDI